MHLGTIIKDPVLGVIIAEALLRTFSYILPLAWISAHVHATPILRITLFFTPYLQIPKIINLDTYPGLRPIEYDFALIPSSGGVIHLVRMRSFPSIET